MDVLFKIDDLILETDRLILRKFRIEDLNDFYEYASVDGVGEMAGWPHHESIEETLQILNMFMFGNNVFALVLKENNKVIGSLGVEIARDIDELADYSCKELGFVLSKDYWGNGLIVEAVNVVIDYLFKRLDLDIITCGYFTRNNRSKRAQDKCGFIPYKSIIYTNRFGYKEDSIVNILTNPNKNIKF